MVSHLGDEKYFCNDSDDSELDYQDIRKTWKCPCCSIPVLIEATTDEGKVIRYYRLAAQDIVEGDFVHVHGAGFSEVLAVGKQNNGYFLAIREYRRLSKLGIRDFFNTLYTGRF